MCTFLKKSIHLFLLAILPTAWLSCSNPRSTDGRQELMDSKESSDTSRWYTYWNADSTQFGFKDAAGNIMVEPKFVGVSYLYVLDHITAVTEEVDNKWSSYYLTKTGKQFGRDSLYFFDNTPDCEHEGFIRFKNHKTDKVGLLNKNGDVIIPAEYNDLTQARNGMLMALKGAEKKYYPGGEHYSWEGGKEFLIDTNGHILIENFKRDDDLNFYSLAISDKASNDPIRKSFKATNGKYYSFVDFDSEFKAWLNKDLLANFTKENLQNSAHDSISFWKEDVGWVAENKLSFIDRNFDLIQSKLMSLKDDKTDYHIFTDGLNPYIYEWDFFTKFYNNCGEALVWRYPIKQIVISYNTETDLQQDHFDFLRTDDGYKLISVSIP
ncbi:hypothetical protein FAZ15_14755 [Sphingobacterium olei]|uniref:WG repeat-containing protein n=1 Tax=Sphingobacterium olei TaxID=2571155 RepID=A0A4U0NK69_9SPHI|nr:WG repeat-containing protein [Sphingobacterium olei]TJZ54739.1 hypothetical protein FAZ15_14755 [Sphingobacterium olei]